METYSFSASPSSTIGRLIGGVFFITMGIALVWLLHFENPDLPERFSGGPWIRFGFIPVFNVYVWYYVAVELREFTRMMTYVQINPDTGILRMRNLWKNEVEVMATSVKSIQPVRPWPLTSGWKHLALVDESGYRHIIHHNVEPLGECMEAIRKLCPNLQKVDYGGLDKHGLWTIRGKM